jgi:hypothetical protein
MSLNYHLVSRVEFLTRIKMEHEDYASMLLY